MFPILRDRLSFIEISDFWSRDMGKAYPHEPLALLEQAWWRGKIRGIAATTRLELLQSMFKSLGERSDLGIVFVREGDEPSPKVTELPDGSASVDMRIHIPIPSEDVSSWNERMCNLAFDALAQTSSTDSYPDLAPFFASIELSFEEFDDWRKECGYHEPAFWGGPASQLQKRKRGRPPEYDWKQVKTRLTEDAKEKGPIQSYDELVQKCSDYASELHPEGKTPDTSTIRDAIKQYRLDSPPIFQSRAK